MKQNIVVATHHKTGTVWMSTVFRAIARRLGANYVDFWGHYGRLDRVLTTPFILLNHNSIFSRHANQLRRDDVRILHLIRDPRDVLISAMHYHKKADEPWLHEKVPGSNDQPVGAGLAHTYQSRNGLPGPSLAFTKAGCVPALWFIT